MKAHRYLAHGEKEGERDCLEAIAPKNRESLMNRNIAGGEKSARRITVAQMEREEIVRAGATVVGHIERETDFLFPNFSTAGDMCLIAAKAERRDFH